MYVLPGTQLHTAMKAAYLCFIYSAIAKDSDLGHMTSLCDAYQGFPR